MERCPASAWQACRLQPSLQDCRLQLGSAKRQVAPFWHCVPAPPAAVPLVLPSACAALAEALITTWTTAAPMCPGMLGSGLQALVLSCLPHAGITDSLCRTSHLPCCRHRHLMSLPGMLALRKHLLLTIQAPAADSTSTCC